MISYIIPHKNRNGLLEVHLKAMENSLFTDYEIIVVDDGSDVVPNGAIPNMAWNGPGGARSHGAFVANGDIIMFVGDDTLPSEDLLLWHWYAHETNPDADVVQGYTMFHPSVLGTYFMSFLDKSGFQANWGSLKTADGGWKRDGSGFFLTTNVSMKKEAWLRAGEFSQRFHNAAWEDVEYGIRLQRNHFKTVFEPNAMNFHFHGYTYPEFCQRQKMEGRERLNICLEHTEMGPGLIQPHVIRDMEHTVSEEELLNNGSRIVNLAVPKLKEMQEGIWAEGLQLMSIIGLTEAINERGGMFNALKHLHTEQEITIVLSAIRAIEKEDYGYAQHCKTWLLDKSAGDWAILALAAEIDLACGDTGSARFFAKESSKIAPKEQWVKGLSK